MRSSDSQGVPAAIEDSLWVVSHQPAVGVQAIALKAAPGPGQKLVITSISFAMGSILGTSLPVSLYVRVKDSGTIIWSSILSILGGINGEHLESPAAIPIAEDHSAEISFGAAGGPGVAQTVCMTGYIAEAL